MVNFSLLGVSLLGVGRRAGRQPARIPPHRAGGEGRLVPETAQRGRAARRRTATGPRSQRPGSVGVAGTFPRRQLSNALRPGTGRGPAQRRSSPRSGASLMGWTPPGLRRSSRPGGAAGRTENSGSEAAPQSTMPAQGRSAATRGAPPCPGPGSPKASQLSGSGHFSLFLAHHSRQPAGLAPGRTAPSVTCGTDCTQSPWHAGAGEDTRATDLRQERRLGLVPPACGLGEVSNRGDHKEHRENRLRKTGHRRWSKPGLRSCIGFGLVLVFWRRSDEFGSKYRH